MREDTIPAEQWFRNERARFNPCDRCDRAADECCECGAPACGEGRFAYLCEDHSRSAYQERSAGI